MDYVILTAIGRFLMARSLRGDSWITDCHRMVAHREELDYDELKDALLAASLTWYACTAVNFLVAALYGFGSDLIVGGKLSGVVLDILAVLLGLPIFSLFLAVESTFRLRLLALSGRVRKPVADAVKVRRYRPRRVDFWVAVVVALGYVFILLLNR